MQVGGWSSPVVHSRVTYPQPGLPRPLLSPSPCIVGPMTLRPALLQLTALALIALTCSAGAMSAPTARQQLPSAPLSQPTRFDWPLASPHPVVRPFHAP